MSELREFLCNYGLLCSTLDEEIAISRLVWSLTDVQLMFTVLITGILYSMGLALFQNIDLFMISRKGFYRIQYLLTPGILNYTRRAAGTNRVKTGKDSTIRIDDMDPIALWICTTI
jgi:hypothetical protein